MIAEDLIDRGKLDLSETYLDGSFAAAKNRGLDVGKTKRGKWTKIMAIADGNGLPIAVGIASASPHEVTLVEKTIENRFIEDTPERIIADKAYNSDPLDENLETSYGIELIAPHKKKSQKTCDSGWKSLTSIQKKMAS